MLCTGNDLRPVIEAGLGSALPDNCQFIGDVREGNVVSVAAFHGWRGDVIDGAWRGFDAEIALWSSGRMGRAFLARCDRYAFTELGLSRLTALVRADNPWHRVITRVGFRKEGQLRGGADGTTDLIVFGIRPGEFAYVRQ